MLFFYGCNVAVATIMFFTFAPIGAELAGLALATATLSGLYTAAARFRQANFSAKARQGNGLRAVDAARRRSSAALGVALPAGGRGAGFAPATKATRSMASCSQRSLNEGRREAHRAGKRSLQ